MHSIFLKNKKLISVALFSLVFFFSTAFLVRYRIFFPSADQETYDFFLSVGGIFVPFFSNLTSILDPLIIIVLMFIASGFLLVNKYKAGAVTLFFSVSISAVLALGIKNIFLIPRPLGIITETGWSFPSIHATTASAFLFIVVFYFRHKISDHFLEGFFKIIAVLFLFLVIVSRLFLEVHWLSDVVAGIFLGTFVSSTVLLMVRFTGLKDYGTDS